MQRIAILAGGGSLPLLLADNIRQQGGQAHIVGVRGEAGPAIEAYPHTWVTWGSVNAIIGALKRESDGTMMIAGSVRRPDLMRLKPDLGLIRYLPQILAMLKGGDDAVLTRLVRFFEAQGLVVKGVTDIAPQLLAQAGTFGSAAAPSDPDIALGFRVLDTLADLDVGQAIVVEAGRVLAIEGVEGTDRMLQRIATLSRQASSNGVVVKGPKRGQDLRVDMPAVGAGTIERLREAHLNALVVVAGKTLLLEREIMQRRASDYSICVQAIDRVSEALAITDDAKQYAGPQFGRVTPSAADAADARIAATIVTRLAPYATGQTAVVVRDHVLAIAAEEGPVDLACRINELRQWGRGRFRTSLGAAAISSDAVSANPQVVASMIEALASAGIAGVAIVSPDGRALRSEVPASAVAAADRCRMFLIALDILATPKAP